MSSTYGKQSPLKTCHLWQLMPEESLQFKGDKLLYGLVEYSLFLNALKGTIEALQAGEFSNLEALVGDRACHIRAYMVAEIANTALESFKKQSVLERVTSLLSTLPHYVSSKSTLDALLQQELDVPLSDDELFLVQSYILRWIRTVDEEGEEITSLPNLQTLIPIATTWNAYRERLAKTPPIPRKIKDALVKQIRLSVSERSVRYVQALAYSPIDKNMVSNCYTPIIEGRLCVPTYWSVKILLQERKLPLVLRQHQIVENKVHRVITLFYDNIGNGIYRLSNPHEGSRKKVVVVIDGYAKLRQEMSRNSLLGLTSPLSKYENPFNMLAGCAAIHPQYPGSDAILETQDPSYSYYRKMGAEWGGSRSNPKTFVAKHFSLQKMHKINGIQYEPESYLTATYSTFYATYTCQLIQKFAKVSTTLDEDKIIIDTETKETLADLGWEIYSHKLLYRRARVEEVTDVETRLILELYIDNIKQQSISELLQMATTHQDPARFVLDHLPYWPLLQEQEALSFLGSNLEFFKHPEVMDLFVDTVKDKEHDWMVLPAIEGLGKALEIPALKQRALLPLIEAATDYRDSFYISDNVLTINMRQAARVELKKLISDPEIESLFKKMLEDESLIQLKFDLMNYLEKLDPLKCALLQEIGYTPELYKGVSPPTLQQFILQEGEEHTAIRIVALRHLADYFFRGVEPWQVEFYDIESNGYGPDFLINNKIREKILRFLQDITKRDWTNNSKVASEAKNVMLSICKHLDAISAGQHPLSQVQDEAKRLQELLLLDAFSRISLI